jgi:hypothetical protein
MLVIFQQWYRVVWSTIKEPTIEQFARQRAKVTQTKRKISKRTWKEKQSFLIRIISSVKKTANAAPNAKSKKAVCKT